MKKVFVLTIVAQISMFSFAAKEPLGDIVEIVELPNTTQAQAYNAAKMWFANSFKSANNVIQYDDLATGTIIGKGNMEYPCKGAWNCLGHQNYKVLFTIKIDTKVDKARLTFSDLLLQAPTTMSGGVVSRGFDTPIYLDKDKQIISDELHNISQTFKNSINVAKNDNW